jgi:hypothetical protein
MPESRRMYEPPMVRKAQCLPQEPPRTFPGGREPHFWERLLQELEVKGDRRDLERIFETRTAEQWEEWATERNPPLAAVRYLGHDEENEEDEAAFAWERRRTPTRGEDKP